jgi:hypothetical protein
MFGKIVMALALTSATLTTPTWARYTGPLLVKEASTGFVIPSYARYEKCEIYANRTVITRTFGGQLRVNSTETRPQTVSGDIQKLLEEAQRTPPKTDVGPVDGPTVKYYGFMIQAGDTVKLVNLEEENGGTGTILINNSEAAITLKNTIEALCSDTIGEPLSRRFD